MKREDIIRLAAGMLYEKGCSVSVRDIIAEAGIQKGHFYYYFKGRDDFFCQMSEYFILEMIRRLNSSPRTLDSVRKFFRDQYEGCVAGSVRSGYMIAYLSSEMFGCGPEVKKNINLWIEYLTGFVAEAIMRAVECPEEEALDYAQFVVSAFNGAMLSARQDARCDMIAVFERQVLDNIFQLYPLKVDDSDGAKIVPDRIVAMLR